MSEENVLKLIMELCEKYQNQAENTKTHLDLYAIFSSATMSITSVCAGAIAANEGG